MIGMDDSFPLAWHRTIELADAHLRIARSTTLSWGQDEDPQEVIPLLLDHGLFEQPLGNHRTLYLNGGTEPVNIQAPNPGHEPWDLVLKPGQAKVLLREFLDGVFTPGWACSILSSEQQMIRLLESELDRIGYTYKEGV